MSTRFLVVAVVAMASFTGCSTVRDRHSGYSYGDAANSQKTGVCNVHHCPMQKKRVPIYYGLPVFDTSAPDPRTRERRFPHAVEFEDGGCMVEEKTTTTIYVCPECKKAEAEWARKHPFSHWAREYRRRVRG